MFVISEHGVKLTQIVAMDALRFDEDDDQFEVEEIERELNKVHLFCYIINLISFYNRRKHDRALSSSLTCSHIIYLTEFCAST